MQSLDQWNYLRILSFSPSLYRRLEPDLDWCRRRVRNRCLTTPAQIRSALHNDRAGNSQDLDFPSRQRDIYAGQGTAESRTGTGPRHTAVAGCAEDNMKRGIAVLLSLSALLVVAYFTASKLAIRHETIAFHDPERDNRLVAVDVAVRRDKEVQANMGLIKLPVAVLNHGNTVKHTEYSFLANIFAARGYLVISPQHDLPTDPPMVTNPGDIYVGRLPQIQRGVANIKFAVEEMKKVEPNADYDKLTMVGHSMGGDISMYFAKQYPEEIKKVVTLDNLRVPFLTEGKLKILSFRSKDPQFKADPDVLPNEEQRENAGITVVQTTFQHDDMRDTGPDEAKNSTKSMLDKLLFNTHSDVPPVDKRNRPPPHF